MASGLLCWTIQIHSISIIDEKAALEYGLFDGIDFLKS